MAINITNVKFVGKKFLSVHSGSNVPDVTISGSDISAEDTGCELRYAPVKPIAHRGAQTRRGSGKTYSFAQVRIGVNT